MTVAEEWRPIAGYEGLYSVSDQGRVRGETRQVAHGPDSMLVRGCILRPNLDRKGYHYVALRRDGRMWTPKVHVLVARAFLGERPLGLVIRHRDGNALRCCVSNLTYGTPSENNLDAVSHGTHGQSRKRACPRGHDFRTENLVRSEAERGHRACLACARARAYLHHHGLPKTALQEVADRYFRHITDKENERAHCA